MNKRIRQATGLKEKEEPIRMYNDLMVLNGRHVHAFSCSISSGPRGVPKLHDHYPCVWVYCDGGSLLFEVLDKLVGPVMRDKTEKIPTVSSDSCPQKMNHIYVSGIQRLSVIHHWNTTP